MAKKERATRQLKVFRNYDLDELIEEVNSFVRESGAYIVNYSLEEQRGNYTVIVFYEE